MTEHERIAAIYDAHVRRVYGYVRARVPFDHDAEDLTAETFLRAFRALGRFRPRHDGAEAAWLLRIAHNLVGNFYRGRRRALSLAELPAEPLAPDDPEGSAAQAEERARLLALVSQLPPRHREVVALKYFGGLRNVEIAEALALDQRTVAAYLSRALDELRRLLGGPPAAGAWESVADEAPAYDIAAALRRGHTGLPGAGGPDGAASPALLDAALRDAAPEPSGAARDRISARLLAPRPGPLAWLLSYLRRGERREES